METASQQGGGTARRKTREGWGDRALVRFREENSPGNFLHSRGYISNMQVEIVAKQKTRARRRPASASDQPSDKKDDAPVLSLSHTIDARPAASASGNFRTSTTTCAWPWPSPATSPARARDRRRSAPHPSLLPSSTTRGQAGAKACWRDGSTRSRRAERSVAPLRSGSCAALRRSCERRRSQYHSPPR